MLSGEGEAAAASPALTPPWGWGNSACRTAAAEAETPRFLALTFLPPGFSPAHLPLGG